MMLAHQNSGAEEVHEPETFTSLLLQQSLLNLARSTLPMLSHSITKQYDDVGTMIIAILWMIN